MVADLVDCPKCGANLPPAAAACPKCGLIFDKWHGPHPSGTAAVPSVPPALPTPPTVTSLGSRNADHPASRNERRLNLRMVVLTLAVCVALFVAGRWSVSSSRPTIVRPAAAPSATSPAGIPASADVQPTGEIKADLASIDAEIRRVEEEDAKYSGGLVKALIGSELHIYRQTRAMLQQRARSWLFGIGLSFTVDGKPLVLPANASEQLAAVEQEVTETRAKVAEAEAEAARYSGGLVQAMSLASAATVRNTLAMLEQHRLALKYSLPQYIGFQRDDTSASPSAAVPFVAPTAVTLEAQEPVRVESFVIRGSGQEASRLFDLEATLYVFKLEYSGESNFIVDLVDENGKRIENLTNVVGNFNGSRAVRIVRRGKYLLNVEHASGPWSATIGPPDSR